MVLPTTVLEYLISLIEVSAATYPQLVTPFEGSEDASFPEGPSIMVYADFDDPANLDSQKSKIIELPCSIYFSCNSSQCEDAKDSFNEALLTALTVHKIISANAYTNLLNTDGVDEVVHFESQEIPILIIRKSAAGSTIQAAFKYKIKGV